MIATLALQATHTEAHFTSANLEIFIHFIHGTKRFEICWPSRRSMFS